MNHRPRRFNKPKWSGPTMAVYRLSDVAGDKNGIKSSSNILFFCAWSVEHWWEGRLCFEFQASEAVDCRQLWDSGRNSAVQRLHNHERLRSPAEGDAQWIDDAGNAFRFPLFFFFSQRPKYANAGILVYTSQTIKPATGKPGDGFTSALKGVLRRGLRACGRANQRILGGETALPTGSQLHAANRAETAGTAPSLPHPTMKHRERRHQPVSCLRGSNPSSHNNNSNKDDNNNFHLLPSINAEPLMLQCGCRKVALHWGEHHVNILQNDLETLRSSSLSLSFSK